MDLLMGKKVMVKHWKSLHCYSVSDNQLNEDKTKGKGKKELAKQAKKEIKKMEERNNSKEINYHQQRQMVYAVNGHGYFKFAKILFNAKRHKRGIKFTQSNEMERRRKS